jgi:ABC-2 type transport system ATP-binding protein
MIAIENQTELILENASPELLRQIETVIENSSARLVEQRRPQTTLERLFIETTKDR